MEGKEYAYITLDRIQFFNEALDSKIQLENN